MSEKKGWGRTVKGWFVIDEDGPKKAKSDASVDDLIAKYANEPVPEPPSAPPNNVQLQGDIPRAAGGVLDLPGIFRAAGISVDEQDRMAKALELLKTLPADTPAAVKKQIVEASLKAFKIPIDDIIEAGAQEIQALEAYSQHGAQDMQRTLADCSKKIEQLNAEVADLKKLMETQVAEQTAATESVNQAKLEVQRVLEFFGQEQVAKVVQASPKLHEPKA
jgi:hypothetical protein